MAAKLQAPLSATDETELLMFLHDVAELTPDLTRAVKLALPTIAVSNPPTQAQVSALAAQLQLLNDNVNLIIDSLQLK